MMEKTFLIFLLSEFLIFEMANGYNDSVIEIELHSLEIKPPENVILSNLNCLKKNKVLVNFQKMPHTYLANKNLPIWIAHENNRYELEFANYVMEDVGPFFTYQNAKKCSAAVYFSKHHYFSGTIDNRYSMFNVPYDYQTKKLKISKYNMIPHGFKHSKKKLLTDIDFEAPSGVYEGEELENEMSKWKFVQSLLPLPDTVYVEILVIVNYDMLELFQNYASLVSYILVTFNSVDMLYSKIDEPKIKLNIAGIIIGDGPESLLEITSNCSISYDGNDEVLVAGCLTETLKEILGFYEEQIPLESYDVAVFITHFDIYGNLENNNEMMFLYLDGYADGPEDGIYDGYRLFSQHTRVSVVHKSQYYYYQSFPVIAHELAHLLNAFHDQGEFRSYDGKCNGNLMRTDGTYCKKCLSFGATALKELKRFFSSRDGCIFHNEPRSLYEPQSVPEFSWTQDKQCQCYGYDSAAYSRSINHILEAWKYVTNLWKINVDCHERLKCIQKTNFPYQNVYDTAHLMPGTPCSFFNGICWNGKCRNIRNGKMI